MFAFALWDEERQVLFCARDRFGEKPLFYALVEDSFAFASEAKALALLKGVDLSVDEGVLAAYAEEGSTRTDASERTLLRGVRQLLPANAVEVSLDGARPSLRAWRYWSVDLSNRKPYGSVDGYRAANDLLDLLTDSVRLRLRSDVRVGSCLSGGLDSSTVVSVMRRLEPAADISTFTGRFTDDPALDEWRYAALVVKANRTDSHQVVPTPQRFAAEAALVYWHADFPIGGLSQFAQWCVFELARRNGVTVLLDGQGSDELLGGYGNDIVRAFLTQLASEHLIAAWTRERNAWARANPKTFSWSKLPFDFPVLREFRPLLRRVTNRPLIRECDLFRDDWLNTARNARPLPEREEQTGPDLALSSFLWRLSFRTMLSSLLRFGDRLSMAHSREVRLPFCDHRIAEFTFTLPPELLVGRGTVKRVLRLAIPGLVPEEIVHRAKQGFVPPQEQWLVGPLRDWVIALTDDAGTIAPFINLARIRSLATASEPVRRRDINVLWASANLLAWNRYAYAPMASSARYELAMSSPSLIKASVQD